MGAGSDRAMWDANEYTLTVNQDVPELAGLTPETELFQEKVRQIAIATFSIVIVETKGISNILESTDFIDVLGAVRTAQNDLGKAFHNAKIGLQTTQESISTEAQPDAQV